MSELTSFGLLVASRLLSHLSSGVSSLKLIASRYSARDFNDSAELLSCVCVVIVSAEENRNSHFSAKNSRSSVDARNRNIFLLIGSVDLNRFLIILLNERRACLHVKSSGFILRQLLNLQSILHARVESDSLLERIEFGEYSIPSSSKKSLTTQPCLSRLGLNSLIMSLSIILLSINFSILNRYLGSI